MADDNAVRRVRMQAASGLRTDVKIKADMPFLPLLTDKNVGGMRCLPLLFSDFVSRTGKQKSIISFLQKGIPLINQPLSVRLSFYCKSLSVPAMDRHGADRQHEWCRAFNTNGVCQRHEWCGAFSTNGVCQLYNVTDTDTSTGKG